jgi:hypothetical protein
MLKPRSQKRAIIGALTSHMQAWRSLRARIGILTVLGDVKDVALVRGALLLLSKLVAYHGEEQDDIIWLRNKTDSDQKLYLDVLAATITSHSSKLFTEEDGEAWNFIIGCLSLPATASRGGHTVSPARNVAPFKDFGPQIRDLSLSKMVTCIYESLSQAQKVTYAYTLVESLLVLPSVSTV